MDTATSDSGSVEILPPNIRQGRNGGQLHSWRKGQSGNPSGGSGAYFEARRICAQATPDAARKQVELINSEDDRVALMATQCVIERGAGKVRDHTEEDALASRIDIRALSGDERAALAKLLQKALGL